MDLHVLDHFVVGEHALFEALRAKTVAKACVPATASVAGATPYLDEVLTIDEAGFQRSLQALA